MDELPPQPAILVLSSGFGVIFYPLLSLGEVRNNWQVPSRVFSEMRLLMNPYMLHHLWIPSALVPQLLLPQGCWLGHTTQTPRPDAGQGRVPQLSSDVAFSFWVWKEVARLSTVIQKLRLWFWLIFFFQLVKTHFTGLCLRQLFS